MSPALLAHLERLLDAEVGRAKVAARGTALRSAGAVVALVLSLGAGAFLCVGIYMALLEEEGPLIAGLIVAAGLAILACIVLAVSFLVLNRRARLRARAEVAMARAAVAGDVTAFMTGLQGAGLSPLALGLAALAAGVVAGTFGGGGGDGTSES